MTAERGEPLIRQALDNGGMPRWREACLATCKPERVLLHERHLSPERAAPENHWIQ